MIDLFGDQISDESYLHRLRISMRGAIDFAGRRQAKRQQLGKVAVAVTLTLDEAMGLLREQDYRCALTRLRFYSLSGGSYGPSRPSIDRVQHAGPYSMGNLRIVLLGVNSLRGTGIDSDMYTVARALTANAA
jgi:hypothetical protein